MPGQGYILFLSLAVMMRKPGRERRENSVISPAGRTLEKLGKCRGRGDSVCLSLGKRFHYGFPIERQAGKAWKAVGGRGAVPEIQKAARRRNGPRNQKAAGGGELSLKQKVTRRGCRPQKIKFLLLVRLSARQASRYYARPYTARFRAGRKNVLYADSPQAAGY